MKKEIEERKASMVLGIISILTGWFMPIVGIILGIIGVSIKKSPTKSTRDFTLNIIGIVVSVLFWIFYAVILMDSLMYY